MVEWEDKGKVEGHYDKKVKEEEEGFFFGGCNGWISQRMHICLFV